MKKVYSSPDIVAFVACKHGHVTNERCEVKFSSPIIVRFLTLCKYQAAF